MGYEKGIILRVIASLSEKRKARLIDNYLNYIGSFQRAIRGGSD